VNDTRIYEDIAKRTGGDIYIGVVGPVRTGKSTFIKRFMEALVIPNIDDIYVKERTKDELPQSGSGKTIMTAEPKFIPEDAVSITLDNTTTFNVRLIDSVGYMIPSAAGLYEDDKERLVTTPWFDYEIPITEAAEIGTSKVINEHSTIGIVVTTDGSATGIPRDDYIEAEERVVAELKSIGKPFLIILNTEDAVSAEAQAKKLSEKYEVTCIAKNCLTLNKEDITDIITCILAEFPITEIALKLPTWIDGMPIDFSLKQKLFEGIITSAENVRKIKDLPDLIKVISTLDDISAVSTISTDMSTGKCIIEISIPQSLFYKTLSSNTGFNIESDKQLISVLSELSKIKTDYDRISTALEDVNKYGFGTIMPTMEEMTLEEPEIVRKNGRYCVKLKASAPSVHLLKTTVETEVSPAVGAGGTSEEIIGLLLQDFEGDAAKIWESNLFGKSLYDIASEDLINKIQKMPNDTQNKMRHTLQRIINEGSNGVICIIL